MSKSSVGGITRSLRASTDQHRCSRVVGVVESRAEIKEAMTLSAQFDDETTTNPDNESQSHNPADEHSSGEVITPTKRDRELSELVDGLEERIAAEREAAAVPGNAAERKRTTRTDPDDKAPD
ncbi:hypothetical protein CJ178_14015 [Rhodococcus sp. ACPA4]|nr:hypothetical protein CJ178_14015 [Rhodococcus sp. ACPA4]PSR42056.1 hypothetical protein C7T36_07485 [Rhodococcus sp. AD45-ID]ROZ49824.1 hypothetical protein EEB13_08105 [Rhodococcus sp. WS3]